MKTAGILSLKPNTTYNYKENIYIAGTGQALLDTEHLASIVAHEFFHSIQMAYNTHKLTPRLWIGKATASWIMFMSTPDNTERLAREILPQYGIYPQYSLDVFLRSDLRTIAY